MHLVRTIFGRHVALLLNLQGNTTTVGVLTGLEHKEFENCRQIKDTLGV